VRTSNRQLVLATRIIKKAIAGGTPNLGDGNGSGDSDNDDNSFDINRYIADFNKQVDNKDILV